MIRFRCGAIPGLSLAISMFAVGCASREASEAYEACVNAEAEAKFEAAAEACRRAIELDADGEVGVQAKAKLESLAPHLQGAAGSSAAPASSAKASVKVSPSRGGSIVVVGEHAVELLLFERGLAEAWIFDAEGRLVASPQSFKLRLTQKGEAGSEIELAWSEQDARFTGATKGEVALTSADVSVEVEVDGKAATGTLTSPVLLVGPTFGGVLFVATAHGAEVAVEADGDLEANLSTAAGAAVQGGIEVAANVEASSGVMQRIDLAWDADLGRFRGEAKAGVELASGPFVLFVDGKFAGRLPKLALRAEASHGGYVVMVGDYSVELAVDGSVLSAFVAGASGAADVSGELDLVIQLGGGAIVKLAWDPPTASYRAKLDAALDLDAQPIRVVIKAGSTVSVGGFAAGSLAAKAKLDAKLDVAAKADLDGAAKATAKAKGSVSAPAVKVDAKANAGSKGKGKAGASAGFSIGK